MTRFFRHILLLLTTLSCFGTVRAADTHTFEINTPLIVTAGEMFRVEFVLDTNKPDDGSFTPPSFEGLDILAGPTTSTGFEFQSINGVSSQKKTCTITYVVVAQSAGNITIGPASIEVDGKRYTTKATPIEVVDGGGASQQQQQGRAAEQGNAVQNKVAKDDIVLRLNLSRTNVYMGEPIRASLTLYTRASIVGFEDVKLPSFNGFWSQELPVDNYKPQRETLDGKVYDSQIIKEYLLYPQQSGSLTIEPTDIAAVARVVIQNARNFDPFFGGGVEEYNVKRKLTTGAITVKVNELPAGAPASFSGAVGEFTISAEMPPAQIKANSAATYTVKISGTGNLTFLQAPTLTLPSSFEAYSVRNTESIRSTTQGTTGYRQYEYPFIARAEGEYEIPPVEFSFFSPQKDAYVTLSTEALKMEVSPDASGGNQPAQVVTSTSKEDVRQLGSDIRFIKLTRPALRKSTAPLMLSGTYFVLLILIIAIFVALYFLLRKMIRDSKNTVLVRNRRANKVAVQRFRAAERFMRSGDRQAFYKEMLRAFWGYMSDKLNIPVADLTKESTREELLRRGVTTEEAQRFTDIMTRCDEAQYSPSTSVEMNEVYTEGVRIISHIESIVKR